MFLMLLPFVFVENLSLCDHMFRLSCRPCVPFWRRRFSARLLLNPKYEQNTLHVLYVESFIDAFVERNGSPNNNVSAFYL
jgi:hypothetical protein